MNIRPANISDVPQIVEMLANDKLGKLRENFQNPLPEPYFKAFDKINRDPNQELVVLEIEVGTLVGTLQLSFLQYLTYTGGIRAQIEQVRVLERERGKGYGRLLFQWAIKRAMEKGAHVVQLTTDKKRPEALHFYQELGFIASHEGVKLHL